jgi:DedD protein
MDRRVKERLVGASILVVVIVLVVPELLSGPAPAPAAERPANIARLAASAPEPVRNITVDLATSKAPAPEPSSDGAGETQSAAAASTAAASAAGGDASGETAAAPPPAATVPPAGPPANTQRAASSARLETAAPAPTNATAARPAAEGTWAVQLGSFASRANADKLMRQLKSQGFSVYVVSGGARSSLRYRVRVGPMADRGAATQTVAKLKALGHIASFVPPAR